MQQQYSSSFCQQDVYHQLDDVPAGVVVTGFSIFGELSDQFFKDVAHTHVVDGNRIQIQFRECFDYRKQAVVLVHFVDLLVKIQTLDNILNICRETLDVRLEVCSQMVRVVDQFSQVIIAGGIELVAGNPVHCLFRILWVLFVLRYKVIVSWWFR